MHRTNCLEIRIEPEVVVVFFFFIVLQIFLESRHILILIAGTWIKLVR